MNCALCILLLMLVPTKQFTMDILENHNGIIYSSFLDAYIETSTKTLSYRINLRLTEHLKKYKKTITNKCMNNTKITDDLDKQLKKLQPLETEASSLIAALRSSEIILSQNRNLEAYIPQLGTNRNNSENCKIVSNIINELKQINTRMSRIMSKNSYVILDFMSLDDLRIDLKSLFRNLELSSQTTSFDLTKPFRTAFFDKTVFFYQFSEEILYFGFHIPLYSKSYIVKIFPQPMIINDILCIYKENLYATTNLSNLITYSNTSYSEYCLRDNIEHKIFCRNPRKTNTCNEKYLFQQSTEFNAECFKSLPKRNMVTRNKYDVYFTIFSPIQIDVTCGSNIFSLQLNASTRISGLLDCSINSSFYQFNSSTDIEYELIISKDITNLLVDNKQKVLIYFFIYFTLLMIICIIVKTICAYHRRKPINEIYTPNIFIAESRQLNADLEREAVIIHDTIV